MFDILPLTDGWFQVIWRGTRGRVRAADVPPDAWKHNAQRRANRLNKRYVECNWCGGPAWQQSPCLVCLSRQ